MKHFIAHHVLRKFKVHTKNNFFSYENGSIFQLVKSFKFSQIMFLDYDKINTLFFFI